MSFGLSMDEEVSDKLMSSRSDIKFPSKLSKGSLKLTIHAYRDESILGLSLEYTVDIPLCMM